MIPQNEHDSTSGAKTRSGLHKRLEIGRQNKHRAIILGPTDTRNTVEVYIGGLNQPPRSSPVRKATLRAKVVGYVESAGRRGLKYRTAVINIRTSRGGAVEVPITAQC